MSQAIVFLEHHPYAILPLAHMCLNWITRVLAISAHQKSTYQKVQLPWCHPYSRAAWYSVECQEISIPVDHIQSKRVNLEQDSECEPLSIPQENELLSILLGDWIWKEHIH